MWQKVKGLLFQNLSTRQTIAKNTFWLGVSNLGGRLIKATIIIYAARVLGASEWGIFSYAISIAAFFAIFADIGISPVVVREAAKFRESPEEQKQILGTALFMKLVFAAIGFAAIIFLTPTVIPKTQIGALLIMPTIAFVFAFDAIREFGFSIMRAAERMEREAALFLLTNAAIVVFGFVFLAMNPNVASFAYAYAAGTGVGMVATAFAVKSQLRGLFSKFSLGTAKKIFSAGWPFAVSSVLGILMIETDILVIGWFWPSEDVGLYSAAQRIVQLLYVVPSVFSVSLLPTFSRLAKKDDAGLKIGLEWALWAVYTAAIPIALGGFVLGKEIIELIFGATFAGAALSFRLLSLTVLISFPAAILGIVLFAYNMQRKLIVYAAIGGMANVVLDLIAIPKYGIAGSAAATLVIQALANAYLWFIVRSVVKPKIFHRLKRAILAGAAMCLAAFGLKALGLHVAPIIAAAGLIYFATLFVLREPIFQEIRSVLRVRSE